MPSLLTFYTASAPICHPSWRGSPPYRGVTLCLPGAALWSGLTPLPSGGPWQAEPHLRHLCADSRSHQQGIDAGYGKEPAFLRALDDANEVFVADVHSVQRVWTERPEIYVPPPKPGRQTRKLQTSSAGITVESLVKEFRAEDWTRCVLRDSTRGELRVDVAHRRVWVWNREESAPRCWHLIVRREVGSPKTIKYSLSNAQADTPILRLAQMQGQRYWVERVFEDAKGECGLADYQALGWRSWHHHVTMVMLAMLFIAEQRVAHQPGLELLSPRDIVEMLKETLPRKPEGRDALVARINQRHERRRGSIESRFRTQRKQAPS